MHSIQEKLIELGAIDKAIESIEIDSWFHTVIITFTGRCSESLVVCRFDECYEISFKHDRGYNKERRANGMLDYKYFIQAIKIFEEEDLYIVNVSAWPLDAKIVCKNINIL